MIRNRVVGRVFIRHTQGMRNFSVRVILHAKASRNQGCSAQ